MEIRDWTLVAPGTAARSAAEQPVLAEALS